MTGYHGIPDASVVSVLLLLCFTCSGMGKNCIFADSPIDTTDISENIDVLKKILLLDYPVSLPSNLKSDDRCFEFWQLHFISKELSRMINVAGKNLSYQIQATWDYFKEVFDHCEIESDCVDFERSNISVFLDSIPPNLKAVKAMMGYPSEQNHRNLSICSPIRCKQPDSGSTPNPGYSALILGTTQTSKSALLQRHHWLLILVPLLVCLFSAVKYSSRISSRPLLIQV